MNLEQIVNNAIRKGYEEEERRQRKRDEEQEEKEYRKRGAKVETRPDTLVMRVCGSIILILAFLSTVQSLL